MYFGYEFQSLAENIDVKDLLNVKERQNMSLPTKKLSGAQNLKRKRKKQGETEKAATFLRVEKSSESSSSELVQHTTEEDLFNISSSDEAHEDEEQHAQEDLAISGMSYAVQNITQEEKLIRIDPTYCAASVSSDEESQQKGVHAKGLDSETCLIPAEGSRPCAANYSFVTECLFLVHHSLNLGFNVCFQKLMQLNQSIGEIQNSRSQNSNMLQTLEEQMKRLMTEYLSLRGALLETSAMEGMSHLHAATATWLVQVVVDEDSAEDREHYFPGSLRPVHFPLSEHASPTLACVPEFLLENLASFLTFVRRFNPRTLEENAERFLNPILTLILTFMDAPHRMLNPHLRARMAECLESFLPHPEERNDLNQLNPNPFGCFHREQLFLTHPHRLHVWKP
uniref:RING-type E3 ubiquitin transferase n=1 Tax=Timema californicum TaxID=61474 RepID=A0A7R9P4M1_TIMCA|nr:unnamed protein product [Timema californicum]